MFKSHLHWLKKKHTKHNRQHLNKTSNLWIYKPYYACQLPLQEECLHIINSVWSQKCLVFSVSKRAENIYRLIYHRSVRSFTQRAMSIFSLFSSNWCSIFLRSWSAGITRTGAGTWNDFWWISQSSYRLWIDSRHSKGITFSSSLHLCFSLSWQVCGEVCR